VAAHECSKGWSLAPVRETVLRIPLHVSVAEPYSHIMEFSTVRPSSQDGLGISVAKLETKKHGRRHTADDLLDAALPTVAAVGFGLVTMEQIAEGSGTTKQTLYAHFGSKDALLEKLFDREYARVWDAVESAVDNTYDPGNPTESFRLRIAPIYAYVAEHPHVLRLLLDPNSPNGHHGGQAIVNETIRRGLLEAASTTSGLDERARVVALTCVPMIAAVVSANMKAVLDSGADSAMAAELTATFLGGGIRAADALIAGWGS
jgi:AcrR family transcriptional regulator